MQQISTPTAGELTNVLRLAFGHLPEAELSVRTEAILLQYGLGTIPLEGIFQAKRNEKLAGALFSQIRHDGSVVLWPPTAPNRETCRELFAAFERYYVEKEAKTAVMLVDLQQRVDAKMFTEFGRFEFLSDLVYLVCESVRFSEKSTQTPENSTLEFVPMRDATGSDFERMVELVRETYRNSRDFPKLVGITPTDDVLRGYQHDSVFHPELWFFVRQNGEDVGALLLTDQPDAQMELTYMGLREEFRGLGFSRAIVAKAHETAKGRNRQFLLTSVDEQNTAALRAYLGQGFVAWDRKKVFARFF